MDTLGIKFLYENIGKGYGGGGRVCQTNLRVKMGFSISMIEIRYF